MRCATVLIGVVLCAALALPAGAAAGLPRTVEEQAEWIGDFFVARVCEECEAEVPEALTLGPREELVQGMKATLSAPLTMGELVGFAQRLTAQLWMCSPDRLPFELELRGRVRASVGGLSVYLSEERPPFYEGCDLLGQIGALLEFLRECLVEEFADSLSDQRGAARTIGASIFSRAGWRIVAEAETPFLPQYKHLLTAEEMESMQERARHHARQAREEWARARERWAELASDQEGNLLREDLLLSRFGSFPGDAGAAFTQDMMIAYGARGPWLTSEEEALLHEQYRAEAAAIAEGAEQ